VQAINEFAVELHKPPETERFAEGTLTALEVPATVCLDHPYRASNSQYGFATHWVGIGCAIPAIMSEIGKLGGCICKSVLTIAVIAHASIIAGNQFLLA
jgi:hypothetical protein